MELHSLQSPTVTTIPSSLSRSGFVERASVSGHILKFPNSKRYPDARKLKLFYFRAQASGTTKFSSVAVEAIANKADLKDEDLIFVAGATGRVGSRTVRELLKLGFRVRAGVRSAQKAETLVQSVQKMKFDDETATEGTQPVEKLEIVECDLEKQDQIEPALGNASVVICCIGASEKEVFDISGPYRIDYQATKNLIDAATVAKVNHFILLTSLGTNKVGFPAAILNLFWGVLIWKGKAEEALIASGLPYTIVRPGGMERPTDAYKETHNITLSQEDTLFGGQVSNLQVAELMAFMAKNRGLSYCKVVEVIAETTAPLTPMEELLAKIPSKRVNIYAPKESDAVGGPDPAPSKIVISDAPSTPIEKEPAQPKAMATRPLSPYIYYEDLKPPTSPTPTPSTSVGAAKASDIDAEPAALKSAASSIQVNLSEPSSTEAFQAEVKKRSPQSPYIYYEDLKPPISPSATPCGSKEIAFGASPPEVLSPFTGGNDVAKITATRIVEKDPPQDLTYHSPYLVYDEYKPPTSPSPNAPTVSLLSTSSMDGGSQMATISGNNTPQPATADKQGDKQHHTEPKLRPLSPFTMYEDLKPPTSPMPSPRKF